MIWYHCQSDNTFVQHFCLLLLTLDPIFTVYFQCQVLPVRGRLPGHDREGEERRHSWRGGSSRYIHTISLVSVECISPIFGGNKESIYQFYLTFPCKQILRCLNHSLVWTIFIYVYIWLLLPKNDIRPVQMLIQYDTNIEIYIES